MPDEDVYLDLHFPKAGIDVSQPFGKQPNRPVSGGGYARTTPVGNNVRSYDRLTGRNRGGSRCGMSRYIDAVGGGTTWVVQNIGLVASSGFTPPGSDMQSSQSGRVLTGVKIVAGNPYVWNPGDTGFTAATNATGATPPLAVSGLLYSAPNNSLMFYADGTVYRYYDPETNTIYNWAATAGTLPVDDENNYARLICTWRGRTVLSGLLKKPQNIYMSRQSDPFDWDYDPAEVDVSIPVAFNATAGLGLIGDVVTCLIPYSDDMLIIGCDHSIFVMRGDPMDGGRIDLITDSVGMAWGQPWCRDNKGIVYFFANRPGVYAMVPGQEPVRISKPIDPLLQDINTGTHIVIAAWNDRFEEARFFVTLLTSPAPTTHFTYEAKNTAWWTDTISNDDLNPLCVAVLDGNRPDDRVVLTGGWDGYIRALDPEATTDDGAEIESDVVIGPLLTKDSDELVIDQMQALLGEDSGEVTLTAQFGSTAERAIASDELPVGTLASGRGVTFPFRRRGHAAYFRLASEEAWQMEMLRVRLSGRGKVARRGR